MKSSNVLISVTVIAIIFLSVTYTACKKNNTEKRLSTACDTDSTFCDYPYECIDGACICPEDRKGIYCDTFITEALTGTYKCSETCPSNINRGNWTSIITLVNNSHDGIVIVNFADTDNKITAKASKYNIVLDSTVINGYTISGTGKVSDRYTEVTIDYTYTDSVGKTSACTLTMEKT